jgi:hypothetical protein
MILNPSSFATPLEDIATSARPVPHERYCAGVDLGQSHDPTAIAVVRRVDADDFDPARSVYQVGHLERLPLGTPYPGVVRHVGRILTAPVLRSAELVIDYTGVGRPCFDLFLNGGMSPIGVTITAGNAVTNDGSIYSVPKLVLISRVQALLHDGRLKIQKSLPDAPALVAELQDFRAEVTDSGYWRFGARSGTHDDLVLAVAIALWRVHGDNQPGWGLLEFYRQQATEAKANPPAPFGWSTAQQQATARKVRLVAPEGISHVQGMFGTSYQVGADRIVEVEEPDAKPLLAAGFRALEKADSAWKKFGGGARCGLAGSQLSPARQALADHQEMLANASAELGRRHSWHDGQGKARLVTKGPAGVCGPPGDGDARGNCITRQPVVALD